MKVNSYENITPGISVYIRKTVGYPFPKRSQNADIGVGSGGGGWVGVHFLNIVYSFNKLAIFGGKIVFLS